MRPGGAQYRFDAIDALSGRTPSRVPSPSPRRGRRSARRAWQSRTAPARRPALSIAPPGVAPNANGAGDAFFAAFVASSALHDASLDEALAAANEVAHARVFDLVRRPLEEILAGLRRSNIS